ncbi:MAG: hypothetical protein KAQ98_00355 [Bacteriovoracaceae bacterium]|nr:hypothetical protein [Bacteriovoracaceae bacterium]
MKRLFMLLAVFTILSGNVFAVNKENKEGQVDGNYSCSASQSSQERRPVGYVVELDEKAQEPVKIEKVIEV